MDWTCPTCNTLNSAYSGHCFRCGTAVPAVPAVSVNPGRSGFNPIQEGLPKTSIPGTDGQMQYVTTIPDQLDFFPCAGLTNAQLTYQDQLGPIRPPNAIVPVPTFRAVWTGPVFDLRADLGSSASYEGDVVPIIRGGAAGAGALLTVRLRLNVADGNDVHLLNLHLAEAGHPNDPRAITFLTVPSTITGALSEGTFTLAADGSSFGVWTTELVLQPPSNPIRYWQPYVTVDVMPRAELVEGTWTTVAAATAPNLTLIASMQ